jgi:phospholipid/cholesterol/gamma-HCH transport system permease protein
MFTAPRRAVGAAAGVEPRGTGDDLHPVLTGDWTATGLTPTVARLPGDNPGAGPATLDFGRVNRMDTAGVVLLLEWPGQTAGTLTAAAVAADRADIVHLTRLVSQASATVVAGSSAPPVPPESGLVMIGRRVSAGAGDLFENLAFYGELLAALGRLLRQPARLRLIPTLSQIERTGLDAIPIIGTANVFVGATIAFLGASLLAQFGASVFAVELVGVSVLREFAVLITAIILAGRSASSFAAEIGAMKMTQEIDAMRVMGVDPFDSLVLPRFLGMLAIMPFLTLLGMITGLAGGLLVLWPVLDLSPEFFLTRIVDNVGLKHFWLGLVKAPVMAVVVAAIGCRHGFATGDDVDQLGRHVTSAVVQALFAILSIDAAFALMFMELGL